MRHALKYPTIAEIQLSFDRHFHSDHELPKAKSFDFRMKRSRIWGLPEVAFESKLTWIVVRQKAGGKEIEKECKIAEDSSGEIMDNLGGGQGYP